VATALFKIVERRTRWQELPLMITMNTRRKREFINLFGGKSKGEDSRQVGMSIYNRLYEVSTVIDFNQV
jgi:hypothetical protein